MGRFVYGGVLQGVAIPGNVVTIGAIQFNASDKMTRSIWKKFHIGEYVTVQHDDFRIKKIWKGKPVGQVE